MESLLEWVDLDWIETLDIKALAKYSGWGCCWLMGFSRSFSDKFFDDLMTWASRKNWIMSLMNPTEVKVEDKIRTVYSTCLFDNLMRYKCTVSSNNYQPDVTISFVNSTNPLAKKIDESSLTINMGEVSGLGLDGLMERLGLVGKISETKMITFVKEPMPEDIIINVKEVAPVEETPEAVVTEAKQVTSVEETSATDNKEAVIVKETTESAKYEEAAKIED